ncbi:hypothetical protein [Natronosalvus vescus]|uniref:hypothetical protein n=1 Tax=Natronosalvus vescus TaxID=2953881 RepID=UPI00209011FF|nr:hypothetical protein [Natronosalvus vescus]
MTSTASLDEPTDEDPIEWQLTPSNSGLLQGLLGFSWSIFGGFVALLFAGSLALLLEGRVAASSTQLTLIAGSGVAGLLVLGWLLSLLSRSNTGRAFLRVRLPEPSDPERSVVEHAPLWHLVVLAGLGALVHAAGFALAIGLERSSFWYLVPIGGVYVAIVSLRWWLPTTGRLTDDRLLVTSFPHERTSGRRWFGEFETTHELKRSPAAESNWMIRRWGLGDTTIVWIARSDGGGPVLAAMPTECVDRLEAWLHGQSSSRRTRRR